MSFKERSYLSVTGSEFHRIVYSEYGADNDRIIVCVHGLTGNGSDFGYLAPALADKGYRVIAVDMPGRGRSDFLPNPEDYCYRQYLHDLSALLAHIGVDDTTEIDWIGTSMGGLLGFRLAGIPGSPIRRMIINDVAPFVPQDALDFIAEYVGREYEFESIEQLAVFMKQMRGPSYGPVTDEQWAYMAQHNHRPLPGGKITYGYDRNIIHMFGKEPVGETVDLWPYWERMTCPALILRGGKSTIFPADVAERMCTTGPGADGKVTFKTLDECGHVPSLMAPYQIEMITDWLKTA